MTAQSTPAAKPAFALEATTDISDLDNFPLPPALADRYGSSAEAYRDLHTAMALITSTLAVKTGKPSVAYFLYALDTTHVALIARTEGGADELLVKPAHEPLEPLFDDLTARLTALSGEGYTLLASDGDIRVQLSPAEELLLWANACAAAGKELTPVTEAAEDSGDAVMTALGDAIREDLSDDDLREELALTAAFASARGDMGADMELLGYVPDVQLLAWSHLLVRAGRGTGVGAALYLGDIARSIANGDAPDVVARALLARIPEEERFALEGAMCFHLLNYRESDDVADHRPLRCNLAVAVEVGLVTWAPELFAWLTSREGLTAWLRPNYAQLECYPKEDPNFNESDVG